MPSPSLQVETATPSRPMTSMKKPPTVGIIGGGQLSRMLCLAATQLGIPTATLERKQNCPAATVSGRHLVGDWNTIEALRALRAESDLLTLENEFVEAEALEQLEREGAILRPGSDCLRTIQDKLLQKQSLQAAGLPTPDFQATDSRTELDEAAERFGYPFVLKRRRNGYDGKGNFTVEDQAMLDEGWSELDGENHPLFAEAFCRFQSEIAIMVCRSSAGPQIHYPAVETIQKNHICHVVKAPAALPSAVEDEAVRIANRAVSTVSGIGSVGVELFLTHDQTFLVNELAPRVHNSGHYTIDACHCSQFENHLRAILGLPLGNPGLVRPAAVMINLLGDGPGRSYPSGVAEALEVDGVHLHLYGKDRSQLGRKMGHLTVIGNSVDDALERAHRAAQPIRFIET